MSNSIFVIQSVIQTLVMDDPKSSSGPTTQNSKLEISSKDSVYSLKQTLTGLYLLTLSHDNPVTLMHRKRDIA